MSSAVESLGADFERVSTTFTQHQSHLSKVSLNCTRSRWIKLQVGVGILGVLRSQSSMFCLGKFRQIHEAEAVESPSAETEPVVVFLPLLLELPRTEVSMGLLYREKAGRSAHTHTHTHREVVCATHKRVYSENPSAAISSTTFPTTLPLSHAKNLLLIQQNIVNMIL